MRDLSELTAVELHAYNRLTMEDADRASTDAIRKAKYDPCCIQHISGQICVLPFGHNPNDIGQVGKLSAKDWPVHYQKEAEMIPDERWVKDAYQRCCPVCFAVITIHRKSDHREWHIKLEKQMVMEARRAVREGG